MVSLTFLHSRSLNNTPNEEIMYAHGLYDGLRVRAGDQVSKSKHCTKRTWNPNVQKTTLWSEVLSESLQLRVSTGALKMIDRLGGLYRYVLQMSEERLGGMGIQIQDLVISAMQERVQSTKVFTQPIPESKLWRISRWQDSEDRVPNQTARIMVPSDFAVRGKRGSPTSRRSTHPRCR
ncbi:hypothetical protein MJO28_003252 [Puccinia striiformis f. sp. tritici]|uniref:Uncharacterized protein n=1 Tax=Puccinia striiformis f. sp. tritici TaxID=168172 RepID=A0ACC0EU92_9BASI|nr:hypothetical protein MJO28_003252 [Puccinia striiformis f. sp. tritici]